MQYIKAKFENSKRSYTYRTDDSVKPGDIVTNDKGSKLTVIDEPVDSGWIMTYGVDKLGTVKKYVEPVEEYRIVDIRDVATGQARMDGRYPLRIGRVCNKPNPQINLPMTVDYLRNADGSDYSGKCLRTSRVMNISVNEKENIVVKTMNSEYEFEPVKAESEE